MSCIWITAGSAVLLFLLVGAVWLHMRRKYIRFTEEVCESIEQILKGSAGEAFDTESDELLSKIQMQLLRLQEITEFHARESERQKQEVQGIVSDISHQLKTPIANIVMYCDTAVNPKLPPEERDTCLKVLKHQVGKLEFLVQSLIQMSRMEQNMICLHTDTVSLTQLLEDAKESIAVRAEKKQIKVEISGTGEKSLRCDEKWTLEALFNVLDNAVKYSAPGSTIRIQSDPMEIYTRIQIQDEGMGIAPEHINDVCKRFYREEQAARTEGLGIGLYLTREIVEKENGYLKIQSKRGIGTSVSVYLLNVD
ncbi:MULTISPECIES: sensor histidine kinase [Lachnospiraceae]|uniref:histidine kinase n=1 Tax=Faecalicatena acetigenes TaxID=2981790 RepID=A0ABT2T8V9_9FIRM|nr:MULTISPECIES: HAMP domain-containing sensor histidine kinase [Lachnospiraceae]MCU6746184.1 HAMP domain-containing histidine kinase [Faecalicatena acetigenes]SCH00155.1 Alkaline phosphatase synthesis sensor protein phoR [uncultured Clostridium sp.]